MADEEQPVLVTNAPPSTPFEDTENPSKAFDVTKPVLVGRLQAEIAEALGHDVQVVVQHTDGSVETSEENPVKVYVSADEDFDGRKVRGVLSKHDPGPTEQQQALLASIETLKSGEDLSIEDLNAVVRALVR